MSPTELYANAFQTTLTAAIVTTPAPLTSETITVAAVAPAALQAAGQFRITIDSEYMIVTAGASTTTWTVTRGAEGSPTATHLNGAAVNHYLTAGGLANVLNGVVSLTSADVALPAHIVISDIAIDLNRPWSDGVTNWNGVNPGDDITTRMQAAINFITGTTTGQTNVTLSGAVSGEIYFSRPGTYIIGTTVTSGVSGTYAYQGVILFPGINQGYGGVSIRIRGPIKPVYSAGVAQPGVVLQSACVGGEMFSAPAAGAGAWPQISLICPQFENLTFVNTADGGGLDMYSAGSCHVHNCFFTSSMVKPAGNRRAVTFSHSPEHGDMILENFWCVGGYKSGCSAAEHLVAYGWHAITGVQNAFELYGSGATIQIGGQVWFSNVDSFIYCVSGGPHITVPTVIWEVGGSLASRLIFDPYGNVTGKLGIHLTSAPPLPKLSLCGQSGWSGGNDWGSQFDIESIHNEPGGWQSKHPKETFKRVLDPVQVYPATPPTGSSPSGDVPGFTSDTWHPWFPAQGAFTLARVDAGCGTTINNPVVTDSAILATDVGRTVTGTGTTKGCYVGTVIPGVSFRLSSDPILQHDVNATATGTASLTIGVASGNNNGVLANANVGAIAQTLLPVKNGMYGGESRIVAMTFTTPAAGVYNIALQCNKVLGTNGLALNGTLISATVTGANISLAIPGHGSNIVGLAGVTNGTTYTLIAKLEIGADQLVKRVTIDLATGAGSPVRLIDYLLTATERAKVGPGSNFPYLQDGLQLAATDTGTIVTSFQVNPLAPDDLSRRGSVVSYTATQGVLTPSTVDAGAGTFHQIAVTDAANFTIPTPIDTPGSSMTQELTFEVAPVASRTDAACATTSGNPVVNDAAVVASDLGRTVTGTGIPATTYVGTVIPGVSFRLSSSSTSQVDVNATATTNPVSLVIGATMGAVTFAIAGAGAYKMAGLALGSPAANLHRNARFVWNGSNWICVYTASSDY